MDAAYVPLSGGTSSPEARTRSRRASLVKAERMTQGEEFTMYARNGYRRVRVFYDASEFDSETRKRGALFYCDANQREKLEGQCMYLSRIEKIYVHEKKTAIFNSTAAEDAVESRCLSLITGSKFGPSIQWNLEAASKEAALDWSFFLHEEQGKAMPIEDSPLKAPRPVQEQQKLSPTKSQPRPENAVAATSLSREVLQVQSGIPVVLHSLQDNLVTKQPFTLMYRGNPHRLLWSARGSKKFNKACQMNVLGGISGVFEGKDVDDPLGQQIWNADSPADELCFSLSGVNPPGQKIDVFFEAESKEKRDIVIKALYFLTSMDDAPNTPPRTPLPTNLSPARKVLSPSNSQRSSPVKNLQPGSPTKRLLQQQQRPPQLQSPSRSPASRARIPPPSSVISPTPLVANRSDRAQSGGSDGQEGMRTLPLASILRMLTDGHTFLTENQLEVDVWFKKTNPHPIDGMFCWSISKEQSNGKIELRDMTELNVDKQRATNFAIVAGITSLHLQADSATTRDAWVQAIRTLLRGIGKGLSERGVSGRQVVTQLSNASVPSKKLSVESQNNANALSLGTVFKSYTDRGIEHVLLFCDAGALFWCSPNLREKIGEQSFLIEEITDIYLGLSLNSNNAQVSANPDSCFSIVCNNKRLDLEAPSVELLTVWLNHLQSVLTEPDSTPVKPPAMAKQGSTADASTSSEAAVDTNVKMMMEGRDVSIRTKVNGEVVTTQSFLFLQPAEADTGGKLCWCAPGLREEVEGQMCYVNAITDIVLEDPVDLASGTIVNFTLAMFKPNHSKRSWVTFSDTQERVQCWVDGIQTIISGLGMVVMPNTMENQPDIPQTVVPNQHSRSRSRRISFTERPKPKLNDPRLKALVDGANFNLYLNDEPSGRRQFVFYDTFPSLEDDEGGAFYFCEPGLRAPDSAQRLRFRDVREVLVGGLAGVFREFAAAGAQPELCFSLCSDSDALNLEALDRQTHKAWLESITALLRLSNRLPQKMHPADLSLMNDRRIPLAPFQGFYPPPPQHAPRLQHSRTPPEKRPPVSSTTILTSTSSSCSTFAPSSTSSSSSSCLPSAISASSSSSSSQPNLISPEPLEREVFSTLQPPQSAFDRSSRPQSRSRALSPSPNNQNQASRARSPVPASQQQQLPQKRNEQMFSSSGLPPLHPPTSLVASISDSQFDEKMSLLYTGSVFKQYFADPNPIGHAEQVKVWYNAGPIGGPPGGWVQLLREGQSGGAPVSLRLAEMRSVYVGKRGAGFKTKTAMQSDDDCCFSMMWLTQSLDLEAETPRVCEAWVSALNALQVQFANQTVESVAGGIQNQIERAGKATEPQRDRFLSTISTRSEKRSERRLSFRTPRPHAPSFEHPMIKYDLDPVPRRESVMVWYVPMQSSPGLLCWGPLGPERVRDPLRSLALEDVRDIYQGKMTGAFRTPLAAGADYTRCVTLRTLRGELNLECDSSAGLKVFVNFLTEVLSAAGLKIIPDETSEGRERSNSRRRFSVLAKTTPSAEFQFKNFFKGPQDAMEAMVEIREDVARLIRHNDSTVHLMKKGSIFTGYAENRRGEFTKKHLLIFYNPLHDDPCGTLYWCEPRAPRHESKHCSLALRDITDVYIGQHTDVFASPVARNADPSLCFSIISRTSKKTLDLEAKSVDTLNAWLFGIHSILLQQGKVLRQGDEIDARLRLMMQTPSTPSREPPPELRVVPLPPQHHYWQLGHGLRANAMISGELTKMLISGRNFRAHTENGGRSVVVRYQKPSDGFPMGALTLQEENAPVLQEDVFPLHAITILGQTQFWKGDPDLCFSVVLANKSIHFQADALEVVMSWLYALNFLLQYYGRVVTLQMENWKRSYHISDVNHNKSSSEMGLDPVSWHMLHTGREFWQYLSSPTGEVTRERVLVYVDRTNGPMLCWGLGEEVHQLSMANIHSIVVGKESPRFQSLAAQAARTHCCLTVNSLDETLDLEAEEFEHVVAWFLGMQDVLVSDGRRINEQYSVGKANDFFQDSPVGSGHFEDGESRSVQEPLPLETDDLPSILREGRVFTMIDFGLGRVSKRNQFFFVENEALYWCAPGQRVTDPACCIPFNSIIEVETEPAVAKQAGSNAERCFSILTATKNLMVEAKSKEIAREFTLGLRDVLEKGVQDDTREEVSPALRLLAKGEVFLNHVVGEAEPTRVFVIFDPHAGASGSLYWRSVREWTGDGDSSCLSLADLTAIFQGKFPPNLPIARTASSGDNACFSLVADGIVSLHLQALSVKVADEWVSALIEVLLGNGNEVQEFEVPKTDNKSYARKRLSVNRLSTTSRDRVSATFLTMMARGQQFTRLRQLLAGVEAASVWLFYADDDDTSCGSLYWLEKRTLSNNNRRADRLEAQSLGNQFPIHMLDAVFVGPGRSNVFSPEARGRCLTLEHKQNGEPLQLVAQTEDQVEEWIAGITYILQSQGVSVDRGYDKATGRRVSVTWPNLPQVSALARGAEFRLFDHTAVRQITLWYTREGAPFGSLHWVNSGTKASAGSMHIHHISKLLVGRQSLVFATPWAAVADVKCCLSVVGIRNQLDLCAPDHATFKTWLTGLQTLLTQSGQTVHLEGGAHGHSGLTVEPYRLPSELAHFDASQLMLEITQKQPPPMSQATRTMMEEGETFLSYHTQASGIVTVIEVRVWFDTKLECLHTCIPSGRERDRQPFFVKHTTEILTGKGTATLQSLTAKEAPPQLCVSLLSPSRQLHLQAKSEDQLRAWLFGLNSLLDAYGIDVMLDSDKVEPGPTPPREQKSNRRYSTLQRDDWMPRVFSPDDYESQAALARMRKGTNFTTLTSSGPLRCMLMYEPKGPSGPMISCREAEGGRPVESANLVCRDISLVLVGRQRPTYSEYNAPEGCFLSIQTPYKTLDLIADVAESVEFWVRGLTYLLNTLGSQISWKEQPRFGRSRYEVGNAPTATNTLMGHEVEAQVKKMTEGHWFNGFFAEEGAGTTTLPVFVFYRVSAGSSLGSLHWSCDPGVADPALCIPLDELAYVMLGKVMPVFLSPVAASTRADCCLTFSTKTIALNIVGETPGIMQTWLISISHILGTVGKKLIMQEDSSVAPPSRIFLVDPVEGVPSTPSPTLRPTPQASLGQGAVACMRKGQRFTRYTSRAEIVDVFYDDETDAIYWGPPSRRDRDPNRCVPLSELEHLYAEKQTHGFEHACARGAVADCCFSLVTHNGFELNLEGPDSESIQNWLSGIPVLAEGMGKAVADDLDVRVRLPY